METGGTRGGVAYKYRVLDQMDRRLVGWLVGCCVVASAVPGRGIADEEECAQLYTRTT